MIRYRRCTGWGVGQDLADLLGGGGDAVVDGAAAGVEAEDLVADARRPARLHLVQVAEHVEPRQTATVVQSTLPSIRSLETSEIGY